MTDGFWAGRRVFLTGHTGFKGSWLALWLKHLGAEVHGYALTPPTTPSLFEAAQVAGDLAGNTLADIRDPKALRDAVQAADPQLVIHMAAQPLVRYSYQEPVETYEVNVLGTVQVLEAVRTCPAVRAALVITSDKCYDNRELSWGYRETDALGGADPYSNSKACTELVTAAYRTSFLKPNGVSVATARAGNVIGGGDWAVDRLLPDFFRAIGSGKTLEIRYPEATRPWQHVLQPLSGYLRLAELMLTDGERYAEAWNFGPSELDARPVRWVLEYLSRQIPGAAWRHTGEKQAHEARSLRLDSSKASLLLNWSPRWTLETALDRTVEWHSAWTHGTDMHGVCLEQLREFESAGGN